MKLTYNKWRLRKYTAVAETKATLRREMQHTASVKRGRSQRQQIPFGVRALESGIEVDGVWISGTNTPNSMPGSPNIAAMKSQSAHRDHSPDAPSSSEMSRIEIPQPVHGYPGINHPAGPSYNTPTPVDRPLPSERQHSKPPSSDHQSHTRPTYQPRRSSHLRFSDSLSPEDSEAFATLEGRSMNADRNGKRPEGEDILLCLASFHANIKSTQDPTHQMKNFASPHHGLATLRTHPAARTIATRTIQFNLSDHQTVISILHLASLRKFVPPTRTAPTDTSLSSLTLLQVTPNHTWTNWVDCMFAIEKVG